MIVYLDLVILTNFLINYLFLTLVNTLFKDRNSITLNIIASIVGVLMLLAFLFSNVIYTVIKIFGGVIISLIAFENKDKKKKTIKITTFYIINFFLIGLLSVYKITNYLLLLIVIILTIIVFIIENNRKYYIFLRTNTYNVSITLGKNNYHLTGFLDTGNNSSYQNKPIIFVSNKYYSDVEDYQLAPISTLTSTNYIKVYRPKQIIINGKLIDALIAFVEINDFDCLLNVNIII